MDSDYLHILIPLILCLVPIEFMLLAVAGKIAASSRLKCSSSFATRLFVYSLGSFSLGALLLVLTSVESVVAGIFAIYFFIVGFLLMMAAGNLLKIDDSRSERSFQALAMWLRVASHFIPILLLIIAIVFLIITVGGTGVILSLFLLVPLVIGLTTAYKSRTRMDQSTILWTLALSIRNQTDLVAELETVSENLSRRFRRRVNRLIPQLRSGVAVASALSRVPRIVPSQSLLILRTGELNGKLGEATLQAAVQHSQAGFFRPASGFSPTMAAVYLVFLPLFALNMVMYVNYSIVPKFKSIFQGFDTELPEPTIIAISIADLIARYAIVIFPLILGLVLFLIAGFMIGFRELNLPLINRLFRRIDVSQLLRALASPASSEKPFRETTQFLASSHRQKSIKAAMNHVDKKCQQGVNLWDAMQTTGLITRPESALLKSAQGAGNLPWALNQLADALERRFAFRWMAILEFLQPAVVLLMGIITFLICLGFFMPLVKLLRDLS
jgi:type II secretory pathway component PulF